MHRDENGAAAGGLALVEQPRERGVVGLEDRPPARRAVVLAKAFVAGDRGCFADDGDRGRVSRRAVAVDHQPRIGLEHRGRVEQRGKPFGDRGDTDVPGDVALALRRIEAERTERARDQPPGMVGCEQEIRDALRPQNADGRVSAGREEVVHPKR